MKVKRVRTAHPPLAKSVEEGFLLNLNGKVTESLGFSDFLFPNLVCFHSPFHAGFLILCL